jgi:hypothetical protein
MQSLTSSARNTGRPIIEGKIDVGKFCPAYPTFAPDDRSVTAALNKFIIINLPSQIQYRYRTLCKAVDKGAA